MSFYMAVDKEGSNRPAIAPMLKSGGHKWSSV